jgi:hypothetical protein
MQRAKEKKSRFLVLDCVDAQIGVTSIQRSTHRVRERGGGELIPGIMEDKAL